MAGTCWYRSVNGIPANTCFPAQYSTGTLAIGVACDTNCSIVLPIPPYDGSYRNKSWNGVSGTE